VKVKDVIKLARYALNDDPDGASPTLRFHTDDELMAYTVAGARETAILRPDLFVAEHEYTCQAGNVLQDAASVGALYVIDVMGVKGGTNLPGGGAPYATAVLKADLDTMRRFDRSWALRDAATAENWFPYPSDQSKRPQSKFYIYPKAPANQALGLQVVQDPWHGITVSLETELAVMPKEILEVQFEYVVFRAESKNDESALSQRAIASWNRFVDVLGRSELKRKIVQQEGRPQ
jgi:hypothetical protein